MLLHMKSKFLKETLGKWTVSVIGFFIIILTLVITYFLFYKGLATFTVHKFSVFDFLLGETWEPDSNKIGAAVFIRGTVLVSLLAIALATPFAIACAIFMNDISPKVGSKFLQPAIEIFVGIPSVVYGWVGVTVLCPFIARSFHITFGNGLSVLAGGIVLAVMIFPTITSVSADALRNVSKDYKEASYALGSTRWQMLSKIALPSASPGIFTGIVLGIDRALGEALAVSMVIGNAMKFPKDILDQTTTLTTQIASAMENAVDNTPAKDSLWTMALLLFVISFLFIIVIRLIGRRAGRGAR